MHRAITLALESLAIAVTLLSASAALAADWRNRQALADASPRDAARLRRNEASLERAERFERSPYGGRLAPREQSHVDAWRRERQREGARMQYER